MMKAERWVRGQPAERLRERWEIHHTKTQIHTPACITPGGRAELQERPDEFRDNVRRILSCCCHTLIRHIWQLNTSLREGFPIHRRMMRKIFTKLCFHAGDPEDSLVCFMSLPVHSKLFWNPHVTTFIHTQPRLILLRLSYHRLPADS